MRFFLGVCALLSLASAETVYLEIKMKGVTSPISQTVLDTLAQSLPGLLKANIPSSYQTLAADYVKYAENVVVKATAPDANSVVSVKAYFPDVPVAWHDKIKAFLNAYSGDASVTDPLSAILPTFLMCGNCEFSSLGAGSDSTTVTPGTNKKSNYIVGFKVLVNGANPVDAALIQTAMNLIPGLLQTEINKLTIAGLTQNIKDTLIKFASQVKLSQQVVANPKGLWVQATFPAIPSSYVELYKPLFMKYVYNNDSVKAFIAAKLPPLLGCAAGACSIGGWGFVNEPFSASPTAAPTAAPTPKPTPETSAAATVPAALAAIAFPVALLAY